eukprot:1312979-Pyramimonas_sp.AAC.1
MIQGVPRDVRAAPRRPSTGFRRRKGSAYLATRLSLFPGALDNDVLCFAGGGWRRSKQAFRLRRVCSGRVHTNELASLDSFCCASQNCGFPLTSTLSDSRNLPLSDAMPH